MSEIQSAEAFFTLTDTKLINMGGEILKEKFLAAVRARDKAIVERLMARIKQRTSWLGDLTYEDVTKSGRDVLRELGGEQ